MISFSDHYSVLLIDRLSSTRKIGKDLWHFNSSLLKKEDFYSTTRNMLSLLRTKKNNYFPTSDWCKYITHFFAKNSTKQENIRISQLKKRLQNLYKKENFKAEIRLMINNLQDELYTLKLNKPQVLKFVPMLDGTCRSKNAPKPFLVFLKDKICKTKLHLNYLLTTKRPNILTILKTFLNLQKKFMRIFTPEEIHLEML